MAQGVHFVQVVAESAKACWACKRVRVICFDDLNIVSRLINGVVIFQRHCKVTVISFFSFLFV